MDRCLNLTNAGIFCVFAWLSLPIQPPTAGAAGRFDFYPVDPSNFTVLFGGSTLFPDFSCMHSAIHLPTGAKALNVTFFPSRLGVEESVVAADYRVALVQVSHNKDTIVLLDETVPVVMAAAEGGITAKSRYNFPHDFTVSNKKHNYRLFACIDDLKAVDVSHTITTRRRASAISGRSCGVVRPGTGPANLTGWPNPISGCTGRNS